MKPRIALLWPDKHGVTTLEFAVIAPLLMALMLGIIVSARLVWTYEALEQTAAAGSRCMGVLESSCTNGGAFNSADTMTYVTATASGWGVTLPASTITLNQSASCGSATGFSTVTIAYSFKTIVPELLTAFAPGITINVAACFPNQPP